MKLLLTLFNNDRKNNFVLLLCVIYCCFLLLIRAKITNSIYLFFLVRNLFLAAIPYAFIIYLENYLIRQCNKIYIILFLSGWLLFLPNSFYIITDLVHITKSAETMRWLDLIIVSSFAIIGFIMGLLSLSKFEILISRLLNPNKVQILIISLLCGAGIYLGRIQRYNSWDIIGNPIKLIINIIAIGTSTELLLFSFNFGLFIYILYQIYKYLFISKHL